MSKLLFAALCGGMACLALCCGKPVGKSNKLLHTPSITKIELVNGHLSEDEFWEMTWSALKNVSDDPEPEEKPYDARILEKSGNIIIESNKDTLGQITGMPKDRDPIPQLAWDASGDNLCLALHSDSYVNHVITIGMVRLPSLQFHSLITISAEQLVCFWMADKVIVMYLEPISTPSAQRGIVFLELDPVSRKTRRIGFDPYSIGFEGAHMSPDHTRIAYYNEPKPPSHRKKKGIQLFDISSGNCQKITYEDASVYYHQPVRWDSSNTLLFMRYSYGGSADVELYRAYLRPPSKKPMRSAR